VLIASAGADGSIVVHEDADLRERDDVLTEVLAKESTALLSLTAPRRLSVAPGDKPAGTPDPAGVAAAKAAAAAAMGTAANRATEEPAVVRRIRPILHCDTANGRGHAPGSSISCLAVSARHRLIASGGTDAAILVWTTETGKREARWQCAGEWFAASFIAVRWTIISNAIRS
jgi:hypothetical protein